MRSFICDFFYPLCYQRGEFAAGLLVLTGH